MPRSRRSSSDDSDSDSSSRSSRSSHSRRSKDSKRSSQTSVSRTAIRDDNWAIRLMKLAAGAPQGPCAVKRITFQVPYETSDDDEDQLYREYSRYYWELVKFDDSISEILARREHQGSRQSTSTKTSRRRRTREFVERPASEPRFEHPGYNQPSEPPYEPMYDPGFFPPPPTQTPHQHWQHAPPPPPPPPPANHGGGGGGGGAGFINLNGPVQGNFREGWD